MTFPSRPEYERQVYGLLDAYPEVVGSTLYMYSTSAFTAIVEGRVTLSNSLVLHIIEALDFKSGRIRHYSYTVFRGDEQIRWYDSQPHPKNASLAETFPHHLHEPPDIKDNRKPAPGISFTAPNLPTLIADCVTLGESPAAGPPRTLRERDTRYVVDTQKQPIAVLLTLEEYEHYLDLLDDEADSQDSELAARLTQAAAQPTTGE